MSSIECLQEQLRSVKGFQAAGVCCGIKQRDLDLALIASDRPATAAGVFTQSSVVGAPVSWCRKQLRTGKVRAIVANSGISNVAMGAQGERAAAGMAKATAKALACQPEEVMVASTGVIGEPLPLSRIQKAMPRLHGQLASDAFARAARAIMTTDLVPKLAQQRVRVAGKSVEVLGIAKGSGMIEPNMATMLAFLVTDAAIAKPLLKRLLKECVDESFNRVSVDGEMSTSDTVLLLANGAAGGKVLRTERDTGVAAFRKALHRVSTTLAKALVQDGEGATKLVHIQVAGAATIAEAESVARRIGNSMLVKTALFGGDPNWGRIVQTMGAAQVRLRLEKAAVTLAGVPVFRAGQALGASARRRAAKAMQAAEFEIKVELGAGRARATLWTCDLSYDYVRINAEYTS